MKKIFITFAFFSAFAVAAAYTMFAARIESVIAKHQITYAIESNNFVSLDGIAGPNWKKVYFLRIYDLNLDRRLEIFGEKARQYARDVPWDGDPRYWSIIVTRRDQSPLIIKMELGRFGVSRNSLRFSEDRAARIALVPREENNYDAKCPESESFRYCLALQNQR